MLNLTSPTGSYEIQIDSWEPRMSLCIYTPRIVALQLQKPILEFRDHHWSLNAAEWIGDMAVKIMLRKYPGSHIPAELAITIECWRCLAILPDGKRVTLTALEEQLDRLLQWSTT